MTADDATPGPDGAPDGAVSTVPRGQVRNNRITLIAIGVVVLIMAAAVIIGTVWNPGNRATGPTTSPALAEVEDRLGFSIQDSDARCLVAALDDDSVSALDVDRAEEPEIVREAVLDCVDPRVLAKQTAINASEADQVDEACAETALAGASDDAWAEYLDAVFGDDPSTVTELEAEFFAAC